VEKELFGTHNAGYAGLDPVEKRNLWTCTGENIDFPVVQSVA
jgi:hypothetical protein